YAVVSSLLFNIVMKGLAKKLARVEVTNPALNVHDITVWCGGSSDGANERDLHEALDDAEEQLKGTGLSLSP
ncbi:hypothetical protein MTO96_044175, partial [Rhipicephalus appendiculatus]